MAIKELNEYNFCGQPLKVEPSRRIMANQNRFNRAYRRPLPHRRRSSSGSSHGHSR